MTKANKIRLLVAIVLVGFAAAYFFHMIMAGLYLKGYPYDTFLFKPGERFQDFLGSHVIAGDPYARKLPNSVEFGNLYFPLATFIELFFSKIPKERSFLLYFFSFSSFAVWISSKYLHLTSKREAILQSFFLVVFSYPFLFLVDRGNFEAFLFMALAIFFYFYETYPRLTAVFLASAISMKLFPVVFLALLVKDRRYKLTFLTIFSTLVICLLGYSILPGGLIRNIGNHLYCLREYGRIYALGDAGWNFSHTLWSMIKIDFSMFNRSTSEATLKFLFGFYPYLSALIFAVVCSIIYFYEDERWKVLCLLTLSMLLLPHNSADYRLIHLFFPLWWFINAKPEKWDSVFCVLFGLLLIPKAYYQFPWRLGLNIGTLMNPLIMILMMSLIICQSLKSTTRPLKASST